jgi:hypothetical protein
VLGHQFGQDFVLGLHFLLQELDPLLFLLDLTGGTFLGDCPYRTRSFAISREGKRRLFAFSVATPRCPWNDPDT